MTGSGKSSEEKPLGRVVFPVLPRMTPLSEQSFLSSSPGGLQGQLCMLQKPLKKAEFFASTAGSDVNLGPSNTLQAHIPSALFSFSAFVTQFPQEQYFQHDGKTQYHFPIQTRSNRPYISVLKTRFLIDIYKCGLLLPNLLKKTSQANVNLAWHVKMLSGLMHSKGCRAGKNHGCNSPSVPSTANLLYLHRKQQ